MSGPKIAVYKLSSCAGCQLEILNLEPVLLDVLGVVDLRYFVMAKRENLSGPYDIGLVEGAVTCGEEIAKLKQARQDCRLLVAMGACACTGGLPAMKNGLREYEVEARVYTELGAIHSTKAYGIDQYVPVDAYLRGCPINKDELVDLIKSALLGTSPVLRPHSVCGECKLAENVCRYTYYGEACLGPVTAAGCGAFCPAHGRACDGCRGPANDTNAAALARGFIELGLDRQAVQRRFTKFAPESPEFKEGVAAV